jgi:hypothetical protein
VEQVTFDDSREIPCPRSLAKGLERKYHNIFSVHGTLKLPETVYVVASGPLGAKPALSIPADACTLACNSAITMPRAFAWWVGFDYRLTQYSWWRTIDLGTARKLFSCRLVNRLQLQPAVRRIEPDYYFNYLPDIVSPTRLNPHFKPTPAAEMLKHGLLRGGLTVSGIALQFAFWFGAKRIVLCGVDMYGTGHHDGFINADRYKLCGAKWPWAAQLQACCDVIAARGCKVYTMSETILRLPEWPA